jgi:hypothetical protein
MKLVNRKAGATTPMLIGYPSPCFGLLQYPIHSPFDLIQKFDPQTRRRLLVVLHSLG